MTGCSGDPHARGSALSHCERDYRPAIPGLFGGDLKALLLSTRGVECSGCENERIRKRKDRVVSRVRGRQGRTPNSYRRYKYNVKKLSIFSRQEARRARQSTEERAEIAVRCLQEILRRSTVHMFFTTPAAPQDDNPDTNDASG